MRGAQEPLIVAEVGLAHDGSLGTAHAFIDAVATTGADAVKFQTHIAEAESSEHETFRVEFSYADATRYDYWQRTAFTAEQWAGLKAHADDKGLLFLSSPFSLAAVELLETIGVPAWKVASGEMSSLRMLRAMAATGKPLIVSTGMAGHAEVDRLVGRLQELCPDRYTLLQCTTRYPTPADAVGLNVMEDYARRYGCPVGLSDHSGTPWPSLVATWLGAALIEVHVTFSRMCFGPDVSSSLTLEALADLVSGIRFVRRMRDQPVDKDAHAAERAPLARLFGKSAFAAAPLAAGDKLEAHHVEFRKPGIGISEEDLHAFIGRTLVRSVAKGDMFAGRDFERE